MTFVANSLASKRCEKVGYQELRSTAYKQEIDPRTKQSDNLVSHAHLSAQARLMKTSLMVPNTVAGTYTRLTQRGCLLIYLGSFNSPH